MKEKYTTAQEAVMMTGLDESKSTLNKAEIDITGFSGLNVESIKIIPKGTTCRIVDSGNSGKLLILNYGRTGTVKDIDEAVTTEHVFSGFAVTIQPQTLQDHRAKNGNEPLYFWYEEV